MKPLLLLGTLVLSGLAIEAEPPVELLDNGGFESEALAPWSNLGTAAQVIEVGADVHSGKYALQIQGTPTGAGVVLNTPPLQAGKSYTFSFFAKAEKGNSARTSIQMAGNTNEIAPPQIVTGDKYQRYEVNFALPKDGSAKIILWKDANLGSGSAYADDFSLTEQKLQDFGSSFPGNAPLYNVKTFGAVGDGVHDDTAAIQTAIGLADGNEVFFPAGRYLISSTLEWKNAQKIWRSDIALIGENQRTTTILLKDHTFTRPESPQAMLKTASHEDWGDGSGFDAFNNFIENLTLDTGKGNPGAIGIDFMGNNRAAIRNTTIQSGGDEAGNEAHDTGRSGAPWLVSAGISMRRDYPGPCFLKNVTIRGFSYGIDVAYQDFSITMEHIVLSGQKIAGIRNQDNVLSIHDLRSDNSVPTLENTTALGFVTLVDADLKGGDKRNAAIINHGSVYLRSIRTSGYTSALEGTPGDKIPFYCSSPPIIFGPVNSPLALPIEDTPPAYVEPAALWADPGLTNGNDDTAAIQATMDSGKHTIYFRSVSYKVTNTITVPSSVWRIVGLGARIYPVGPSFADGNAPRPVIRFTGTSHDVVVDNLSFGVWNFNAPGAIYIENASTKALALVDDAIEGGMHHAYQNTAAGSGPLFLEDTCLDLGNSLVRTAPGWQFNHEKVWMRQFNDEIGPLRIANDGGDLWILGSKSERGGGIIGTTDGGKTELLGGLLYSWCPPGAPAFTAKDSSLSLTYATTSYHPENEYTVQVAQTNGAQETNLTHADLEKKGLAGGSRTMVPLFISSPDKDSFQANKVTP